MDNDDDLVVVGEQRQNLPHARFHCLNHKFIKVRKTGGVKRQPTHILTTFCSSLVARLLLAPHPLQANPTSIHNKKYCDQCFCYVCDKKVTECTNWGRHYAADDSSATWRRLREEKMRGGTR